MDTSLNIRPSIVPHQRPQSVGVSISDNGIVSVFQDQTRLNISHDGSTVSVEEDGRIQEFSTTTIPAHLCDLLSIGKRFLNTSSVFNPRVVINMEGASARLCQSNFIIDFSRKGWKSRWEYFPSAISGNFTDNHLQEHFQFSPRNVLALSEKRAKLLCETFFLWQECIKVERSLSKMKALPIEISYDMFVTTFTACPPLGWGLRINKKILFILFTDFHSISITQRRNGKLMITSTNPAGVQEVVYLSRDLPCSLRERLGALLILLRAVIDPDEADVKNCADITCVNGL